MPYLITNGVPADKDNGDQPLNKLSPLQDRGRAQDHHVWGHVLPWLQVTSTCGNIPVTESLCGTEGLPESQDRSAPFQQPAYLSYLSSLSHLAVCSFDHTSNHTSQILSPASNDTTINKSGKTDQQEESVC